MGVFKTVAGFCGSCLLLVATPLLGYALGLALEAFAGAPILLSGERLPEILAGILCVPVSLFATALLGWAFAASLD